MAQYIGVKRSLSITFASFVKQLFGISYNARFTFENTTYVVHVFQIVLFVFVIHLKTFY